MMWWIAAVVAAPPVYVALRFVIALLERDERYFWPEGWDKE